MPARDLASYVLVKEFLGSVGGEGAVELVRACQKKKGVSDEYLAKKLGLKVTGVRTILNRLHYRGIVEYQKDKNMKTGWYSYTWEVKPKRIAELIMGQQEEELEKIAKKLEFEKNYDFFSCTRGCESLAFELAAEYQFKCPECGQTMIKTDNKKRLRKMQEKMDLIKKELLSMQKVLKPA